MSTLYSFRARIFSSLFFYPFGLGVLGALAFSPLYLFPLFALSFWFLLHRLSHLSSFGAFVFAFAYGAGYGLFSVYWILNAFFVDAHFFAFIPLAILGIMFAFGLLKGIMGIFLRFFPPSSLLFVLAISSVWTLVEMLQGLVFPWNFVSAMLTFHPLFFQSVSLYGMYGLTFVVIFFLSLLCGAFVYGRLQFLLYACVMGIVFFGFGTIRLSLYPTAFSPISLRLIQTDVPQGDKLHGLQAQDRFADLLQRSIVPDSYAPDSFVLTLWAESAVPFAIDSTSMDSFLTAIAPIAQHGALITGLVLHQRIGDSRKVYNSFVAVDRHGGTTVYHKHHLVPFGEYVPLSSVFPWLTPLVGIDNFNAGTGARTLLVDGLPPFAPIICYEILFPHGIIDSVAVPPAFLVQVTNDGWFGSSAGPYQHFALSRLRAVENGLPLVRIANGGISAVVDSMGRVVARLDLGKIAVLESLLPLPSGWHFYTRNTDYFLCFVLLFFTVFMLRKRKNDKRP